MQHWTLALLLPLSLISGTIYSSMFAARFFHRDYGTNRHCIHHLLSLVQYRDTLSTTETECPLCPSHHKSVLFSLLRRRGGRRLQLPRRHNFGQLLVQSRKVVAAVKSKGFSAKKERSTLNVRLNLIKVPETA